MPHTSPTKASEQLSVCSLQFEFFFKCYLSWLPSVLGACKKRASLTWPLSQPLVQPADHTPRSDTPVACLVVCCSWPGTDPGPKLCLPACFYSTLPVPTAQRRSSKAPDIKESLECVITYVASEIPALSQWNSYIKEIIFKLLCYSSRCHISW